MSNAIAVASVLEETPLLPHFINHYDQLGVDRIVICTRNELADRVRTCFPCPKLVIAAVNQRGENQPFNEWKDRNEDLAITQHGGVSNDDYKLCLDIDEFHEYPLPLKLLMNRMNEGRVNEWALCGYLIDRFGPNYSTPVVDKDRDLFEQFPLEDPTFTERSGACPRKIMICRVHCRLGHGRHHTEEGHFDRHHRVGLCVTQFKVHHFKWIAGVAERLEKRVNDPTRETAYTSELKAQLAQLKENQRSNS
jgi:hypothetical protein